MQNDSKLSASRDQSISEACSGKPRLDDSPRKRGSSLRRSTLSVSLTAIALSIFISGCATPKEDYELHIPIVVTKKHPNTVAVLVSGAEERSKYLPKVEGPKLRAQLMDAIEECGLFSRVVEKGPADFILAGRLDVDNPPDFVLTCTTTIRGNWTLTRSTDNAVVFSGSVTASGTAGMESGQVRGARSVDRAQRNYIHDLLQAISQVDF